MAEVWVYSVEGVLLDAAGVLFIALLTRQTSTIDIIKQDTKAGRLAYTRTAGVGNVLNKNAFLI